MARQRSGMTFDEVAERDGDLTARQRKVLDLIVAGRTNGEIGEALGITLYGAKWNVSEILSKLGLASREEAAEYWRWRKRRFVGAGRVLTRMRALALAPLGKLALGGGAAAALVVATGVILFQPSEANDDTPAFYMEYVTEIQTKAIRRALFDDVFFGLSPELIVDRTRVWSADPGRSYMEFAREQPVLDSGLISTTTRDGEFAWTWYAELDGYDRFSLVDLPGGGEDYGGYPVGPSAYDDVDALVASLVPERDGGYARVAGEEEILGRRTLVIEYGPTYEARPDWGIPKDGGVGRMWVDPEGMFIFRWDEDSGNEMRSTTVQALWLDEAIDDSMVTFVPPADAKKLPRSRNIVTESMLGLALGREIVAPPGMFSPQYLPDGLEALSGGAGMPRSLIDGFAVYLTPGAQPEAATYLRP